MYEPKKRFEIMEQLSKFKTLHKAKLESELSERIKEEYHHLLEKPRGRIVEQISTSIDD